MLKNKMKIAVSSTGPTLDDAVEPRFGRCAYFLIIDPDSLAFESIQNPNIALGGGTGPQSSQLLANKGVSIVLTGNCGPNDLQTFGAAGIQVLTGMTGQIRKAVERFNSEELSPITGPSVQRHFGMGRGMGGGRDMAGGRITGQSGAGFPSRKEEIARLGQQMDEIHEQIESIDARLGEI